MKINDEIVRDYLAGKSVAGYRSAWFFQRGRPFTEPSYSTVDEAERAAYLSRANCGKYYEKFACMAGMLYLAEQWLQGGTPALAERFQAGYHGFAAQCAR